MGTWHEQRKIQEPKFDREAVNLGDQLAQGVRYLQDMGLSGLKPEKFLADWDDWSPYIK